MLIPSRRIFYAVEAVVYIASKHGVAVNSIDIATALGVQWRYLEPTLQKLVHAGLLVGKRGLRGGYILAKDANVMTLRGIADVFDPESMLVSGHTTKGKSMLMGISKACLSLEQELLEKITVASFL